MAEEICEAEQCNKPSIKSVIARMAEHNQVLEILNVGISPDGLTIYVAPPSTSTAEIKTWQERCDWWSERSSTKLMVEAMKAEIAELRAALSANAADREAKEPPMQQCGWMYIDDDGHGPFHCDSEKYANRYLHNWAVFRRAPAGGHVCDYKLAYGCCSQCAVIDHAGVGLETDKEKNS